MVSQAKEISLNVAIGNGMVQLFAEYTGRGPTRARTTISGDLIAVVLRDAPEDALDALSAP
jgi:hypothetical protein